MCLHPSRQVGWPARGPRRAAGAALLLIAALCVAAAPPTAAVLRNPVTNAFYKAGERAHTDKVTSHSYHHTYELLLRPLRHKRMKVLEIGLGCTMNTGSASINLWQGACVPCCGRLRAAAGAGVPGLIRRGVLHCMPDMMR